MSRETIIKEAIDDLKHGIEVGNIILQMPEDEHIISILIQTLEKQIGMLPNFEGPTNEAQDDVEIYCPECDYYFENELSFCPECGQKILWF